MLTSGWPMQSSLHVSGVFCVLVPLKREKKIKFVGREWGRIKEELR